MKVINFLFSGVFMGITLIIFAVALSYGTFIENDYDATTAKFFVYNARWFEVLLFLMVVNFTGMIFTKKLYLKSRINILVIHLALILIIIGAAITRYVGFEGQMHIRNGQTTNEFLTTDIYLNIDLSKGGNSQSVKRKILLPSTGSNIFSENYSFEAQDINISIEKYYPNAVETLTSSEKGDSYLNIVAGGADGRHDLYLREGQTKYIHDLGMSFGDTSQIDAIQIISEEGKLLIRFPKDRWLSDTIDADKLVFQPFELMQFHSHQGISFVVKQFIESATIQYTENPEPNQQGFQIAKLNVNNSNVFLKMIQPEKLRVNDVDIELSISKKILELPFSLKLNEFKIERYPGSQSPSSFASDITLIDEINKVERPYSIFMNNILNYGGYRFYQSSYDKDEQGTILSVNHDYWGTLVTYIGYFLLIGSLIVSFITPKTRFARITQQLKEVRKKRNSMLQVGIVFICLAITNSASGQEEPTNSNIDKEHAALFGKLLVQTKEGRISTINTLANQVLVKIYKKNSFNGLTPEQVFLGMVADPMEWQKKPLVKIKNDALKSLLGIQGEYGRFFEFFDDQGQYKLKEHIENAYLKKPALRTKFDKELISVDERMNVYFSTLNKSYLNILPVPDHPHNKWITPYDNRQPGEPAEQGIDSMFAEYLTKLHQAMASNDYGEANTALAGISGYQKLNGGAIIPAETKINLEIFYNNTNIFNRLFPIYLFVGLLLVGIFFVQVFIPALQLKLVRNIFGVILFLAFIVQTFGLVLRWYISGHAPWSNGYESMIYISWATMLAGFIFARKSASTLSVSAVLAGITLLTAHMSWMDPEITNLVPVLKSYWLTIHVATITASYGFLGLGALMGFLNLCIMIGRNKNNYARVNLTLTELTLILELSLIAGLVLLVTGTFLGGIWANESWGRYWGWDPKETWSLITIIVYSFILHSGLINRLKNVFTFNVMAAMGFGAILMTYFGVNYYLSGLHSYAQGDSVPVPAFVYYLLMILASIVILSGVNEYKMQRTTTNTSHNPNN
jgi:cytochrome c-type biogenesis protein CcsB